MQNIQLNLQHALGANTICRVSLATMCQQHAVSLAQVLLSCIWFCRMLAMGGAPVLGFDIQADSLAKHRASLHPTDGRAAAEVQASASSAASDDAEFANPAGPDPLNQGRTFIPVQQV